MRNRRCSSSACCKNPVWIAIAFALAYAAGTARAQTGGSGGIDVRDATVRTLREIEVVGREDDDASLPAARTRLDGAELGMPGQAELADIASRVPGLSLSGEGGRATQEFVSLRGYTNAWSAPGAAVLLRIDGVPMNDLLAFDQRLFDLHDISVWRGPQGTHFGANAEAGVIDITSLKPAAKIHAWIGADLAERGGYVASTGISGALTPDIRASIAAVRDGSGGQIDNLAGGRSGDRQRAGNARARLVWQTGPRNEIDLMLLHHSIDDHGGEHYLPVDLSAFNALPTLHGYQLGRFDEALDTPGYARANSSLAALTDTWRGDAFQLSALVSVRDNGVANASDYDLSPQPWYVMTSRYRVRETYAELRAESPDGTNDATHWLAGISASHRDFATLRRFAVGAAGNPLQFPPGVYTRTDADLGDHNAAAFGEIDRALDAGRRWHLGAGLRLQRSARDLDFGATPLAPGARLQRNDTLALPKFSLEYRAEAWSAHASIAAGAQPGGFNPGTFNASQAEFRPERTRAFELGLRAAADGFDLQINAFDNRVRDFQDLTLSTSELTTYVRNVRRARIRGIEIEGGWQASEHWRLAATGARIDAVYVDDVLDSASGFGLAGRRLPQVPRHNLRLTLEYANGPWTAHLAGVATGSFVVNAYDGVGKALSEAAISGHHTLDAGIGYRHASWSFRLDARNLADRRYFTSATFGFAGTALYPGAVGSLGQRRTLGVSTRWDY